MKKTLLLILVACLFLAFFSCKKESTSDLMVYWNTTTTNEDAPINQELQQIYSTFDNAFSRASFGNVVNHSIPANGVTKDQIINILTEIRQLSAQADASLNEFDPTICYTVTLTVSTDNKPEDIAVYYYCPKDPGNGDDNGDDNGDNNDDNGDDNGDDDPTHGDGIVDPENVFALKPVFYAPLTSDLQDLVSGTYGTLYGTQGTFTDRGMVFNHNRVLWTSGWWDDITYNTPFTILADYKRTGSNTEHMHIINSSPGPGVSVERGFDIACRNGYQNNLITGVIKNWVNYGVTSPNTALVNTQHFLTGFIYDGNGHITRVQDGIITSETYTISPSNFPDFAGTYLCIGGLNNYYKDFWIGTIANVMIFDRVLSQVNITSMH